MTQIKKNFFPSYLGECVDRLDVLVRESARLRLPVLLQHVVSHDDGGEDGEPLPGVEGAIVLVTVHA